MKIYQEFAQTGIKNKMPFHRWSEML